MIADRRVAVVTGANRGLGLETCRQLGEQGYRVVLTSRERSAGEAAARSLCEAGHDAAYHQLDVTDPSHIAALAAWLGDAMGRVDVLVNNAGIFPEGENYPNVTSALEVDMATLRRTLETNTVGHLALCQALIPMMQAANYGRVVILSSVSGRLADMGGGMAGYRFSHVCNNAMARILAAETAGSNILVNSVCPYWVKTRMGGPNAVRSVEEGVETIVWLATLPDGGPTGGFFRDRRPLEW